MENFEKKCCRFCSDIVRDDKFKIIEGIIKEVLDVLLLKLTTDENKPVICSACSAKLFAAFEFKVACTDTEDIIFPYVRNKNVVDLRDVYLKERGKEHLKSILEDERICRLCMQVITRGFTSVEEVDIDTLRTYIPEVNFNSTKEPVICKICVDSLHTHTNLLNNFWCIEEETNDIENMSNIKHEVVDIKSEENYSDASLKDEPASKCRSKSAKTTNASMLQGKGKRRRLYKYCELKYITSSGDLMYKCNLCDYMSSKIISLERHHRKHKHSEMGMYNSEVGMYECASCDYKSRNKSLLKQHQLKHTTQRYKCDLCDFKTIYKNYLTQHQLTHKEVPEEQLFKCDLCDYKTIQKQYFRRHQQRHKDISDVQMHKCSLCDYRTTQKGHLKRHQLRHQETSEKEMFHCHLCDFITNEKGNLTRHQIKHEKQKYKCDSCDFKTNYKTYLAQHQLKHIDIPEDQMYRCDSCDYKSNKKNLLRLHRQRHIDVPEAQMFRCDLCHYKTGRRRNLRQHQQRHKVKVPRYQCDSCDFKTKYKGNLTQHQFEKHKRDTHKERMYK